MNPLQPAKNRHLTSFYLAEYEPIVAGSAFVAPGAVLVGAVSIGEECSVWYGAVLRGDIHRIAVGEQSNIQDGSVLHVADDYPCAIANLVTVGHRAVVHACSIGPEVLVGMGAIVMDGAEIGARSIIAAGALVPKGMTVPEGSLVMGVPAKVVRKVTPEEALANRALALKYVELSRRYIELGYAQ